jgi:hypothetical protein
MKRSTFFRRGALSWLPWLSMAVVAQAQSYDVSKDWLTSYPTTTAIAAATSSTWGAGSAWSAGQMSSNWANTQTQPTYLGAGYEDLTTYYKPTTSFLNSGASVVATYSSTVPFQTYQLNPGSTINLAVGQAMTEQVASGFKPYNGGANAITFPSALVSQGAASGVVKEVAAVEQLHNVIGSAIKGIYGFDVVGYGTGSFKNGSGSVQSTPAGVFYNYNTTNQTSSSPAAGNAPSSAGDALATGGSKFDTVTMNPTFTPSYVAWTAPATGIANINMNGWDVGTNSGDGEPSFFVITSIGGPTAPLFSANSLLSNGALTGAPNSFTAANNNVSATQGTIGYLTGLSSYTGNNAGYPASGFSWQSGNISVTAGEKLYFVADPTHTTTTGWTAQAYDGMQDPIALNDNITFVPSPEPSTFVLLAMASAGLTLAAWKRRRLAA